MPTRRVRQSEIKTFKRCRRKWNLQYVRNLERVRYDDDEPDVARVGIQVHDALDAYYRGSDPDQVAIPSDPLAAIIVEGYFEWVADTGADAGLEVIHSEERLSVPYGTYLGVDIVVTGRLDLVVHDAVTGLNLLLDHKTVQSFDQFGAQLKVDDQLLTYVALLRAQGIEVDGAMHNMLRRVKRTPRATPPFYERRIVRFNDTQLANHHTHMQSTLGELMHSAHRLDSNPADHHLYAVPNPTKDCTWDCPFLAVCPMMDDGSDWEGLLANEYRQREEHV